MPELEAQFTARLSTAARKMRSLFDSRVREHGLTLARAQALLLLAGQKDWNQSELAAALEIEQPSVAKLLDGLEKQGFILRSPVESDRRVKRIELTDAAQAQVRQIQDMTHSIRADLLQNIDRQSLETALSVLHEITKKIEEMPAGMPE